MPSLFDVALSVVSRSGEELDLSERRALAEMRARIERMRELSTEFSSVELSPYVKDLLGAPSRFVCEPARRAAGI